MCHPTTCRWLPILGLSTLASAVIWGVSLDEFQVMDDNRIEVRRSLGVRSAHALTPDTIEVTLGMSVTAAAKIAGAYRVISSDDDAYAFERFVRPVAVEVRLTRELAGVAGGPNGGFDATVAKLTLPTPIKAGAHYAVIAQGDAGMMITGAHTAAPLSLGAVDDRDPRIDLAVLSLRQIEPVGPALIRLEFGPNFNPEACTDLANYQVRIQGKPVPVVRLGRRTRLDTYLPIGWPYLPILMHDMYLELARPVGEGETIEVEVRPAVTDGVRTAHLTFAAAHVASRSIQVNQVGYLASGVKIAYLGRWLGSFPEPPPRGAAGGAGHAGASTDDFFKALGGDATSAPAAPAAAGGVTNGPALAFPTPPAFTLCEAASGKAVFTGHAQLVHSSGMLNEGHYACDHSGANVYALDFSAFTTPGQYRVVVAQVGCSLPFAIGDDVYSRAFVVQAHGVLAQRCGIEMRPPWSDWRRIACHSHGLIPTVAQKLDNTDFKELPHQIDYAGVTPGAEDPEMVRLRSDPALVARWVLDHDLADGSGHHQALQSLGGQSHFVPDRVLLAGAHQVLAMEDADNAGFTSPLAVDDSNGLTMCGWFCQVVERNNWHGVLMGFGADDPKQRCYISSGWGVLRLHLAADSDTEYGRLPDNTWHHLAVVIAPRSANPRTASWYDNGHLVRTATCPGPISTTGFALYRTKGETGSKQISDVRVYARALAGAEVATLATKWGEGNLAIVAAGGHHDAGDYNPRSHIDVAQTLMDVYEMRPQNFRDGQLTIPENHNGIPDILDEAAWALRLWKGLQDADGGVHNGTESNGDPDFITTAELDSLGDYAYAKDAAGSYTAAGAFAQASIIWTSIGRVDEAKDYLGRAERAFAWAEQHAPAKFTGAADIAARLLDPKAYAAAQLLRATRNPMYNQAFLAACVWAKKADAALDVYQLYNQSRAAWAYVNCDDAIVDAKVKASAKAAIIRWADEMIANAKTMGYAFVRHPYAPVSWGTGAYEHWVQTVMWAHTLTHDDATYLPWIIRTCDNTLGANPLGLSYITGLGTRTVHAPLHNSRYGQSGEVVEGIQVEGPVQGAPGYQVRETMYPPPREDFACLSTFVDCHFAIDMDEPTTPSMAESMATFGYLLKPAPAAR